MFITIKSAQNGYIVTTDDVKDYICKDAREAVGQVAFLLGEYEAEKVIEEEQGEEEKEQTEGKTK